MPTAYGLRVQEAILRAIVDASITEADGVRKAHIQTAEVLDAFGIITASLLASSPETQTTDGVKRVLRRQARQLERRMFEFRRHTAQHGSPFASA